MGLNTEEKHYGFYRAVVIQNNDPDRAGRVKIFIPEFSAHFARSSGITEGELKLCFVGGTNTDTFMKGPVLQDFKKAMRWIEQASPLVGSGTAGVYDAKNDIATVGDGYHGAPFEELGEESITPSGEAVSPKAIHSVHGIEGSFGVGSNTGLCDPRNQTMMPSAINNATKGLFSIPRVGAWVWIFFENGSLEHPVYFGYSFGKNDWNSVFNPQGSNPSPHYPAGSENIEDGNTYFHTGQMVFNSKAGSLEFTDTDDFENIRLSHFSGSFWAIGNNHWYDNCVSNKTYNVLKDEFHTVNGNRALKVNGDSHETYEGQHYITYGNLQNKPVYQDWVDTAAPAFSQAALFAEKERIIKDPTLTGESTKTGPNTKYSHPAELTLKNDNWNSLLKQINPKDYLKQDQLKVLGVNKI